MVGAECGAKPYTASVPFSSSMMMWCLLTPSSYAKLMGLAMQDCNHCLEQSCSNHVLIIFAIAVYATCVLKNAIICYCNNACQGHDNEKQAPSESSA